MSSKNNPPEEATANETLSKLPSINEDNDDNSEFDVSEAKENKTKSSENSPPISATNSPTHPTTRSESSLNATLSDSGRVKRKCVIESEKRKLYMTDFDSPPYMPLEEEIPQKLPRVKGRRGRPPKSATLLAAAAAHGANDRYSMGIRRVNDMGHPSYLYQSTPRDGYTYTFSTALANVSCRLVMDGHFRSIIDHHKTINFPQNIFSHDIIPTAIQHQKPHLVNTANNMVRSNVQLPHLFNQPGPHIYRQGIPHMPPHLSQPQHVYHGMMPPTQPIPQHNMRQIPANIPMISNYTDYSNPDNTNIYRLSHTNTGVNNRRPITPSAHAPPPQNRPPPGANLTSQFTNVSTHPSQRVINPSNSVDVNHVPNAPHPSSANANRHNLQPPSGTSNSSTTTSESVTANTVGAANVWLPTKNFQSATSSFPMNTTSEKSSHHSLTPGSDSNQFHPMGAAETSSVSNAQRNETTNQLPNKMDNTEQLVKQTNSVTSSTVYPSTKDL